MNKIETVEKVILSDEQIRLLGALWSIYGNSGKFYTLGNHRFIQGIIERGEWDERLKPTPSCLESVKKVL